MVADFIRAIGFDVAPQISASVSGLSADVANLLRLVCNLDDEAVWGFVLIGTPLSLEPSNIDPYWAVLIFRRQELNSRQVIIPFVVLHEGGL